MEKLTKNKVRRAICEAGLIKLLLLHGNEKITSNEGKESSIAEFLFWQIEDVVFENNEAVGILNICIDLYHRKIPINSNGPIFHKIEAMSIYIKDLLKTPYEKQGAGNCDLKGNIIRMANVLKGKHVAPQYSEADFILMNDVIKESPVYNAMEISEKDVAFLLDGKAELIDHHFIIGADHKDGWHNRCESASIYGVRFDKSIPDSSKRKYFVQYRDYLWYIDSFMEVAEKIKQLEYADKELYIDWVERGKPKSEIAEPNF